MTATAIIATGEPKVSDFTGKPYASITARCSECRYMMRTGGDPDRDWSHILDDHLDQHKPGRVLDIEVEWELVAACSVCPDGGEVRQQDDFLRCNMCGTTWDTRGRHGERVQP